MAVNKHPGKTRKWYKGYQIFESQSRDAKNVITKTNICVLGRKRKVIADGFKTLAAAEVFIDARIDKFS